MPDNGFGAKDNSPDYVLRLYRISPDFRTSTAARGTIEVESFITLRDPDHKITFPIVADGESIRAAPFRLTSDPRHRWLTGGDFDIESVRGRTTARSGSATSSGRS